MAVKNLRLWSQLKRTGHRAMPRYTKKSLAKKSDQELKRLLGVQKKPTDGETKVLIKRILAKKVVTTKGNKRGRPFKKTIDIQDLVKTHIQDLVDPQVRGALTISTDELNNMVKQQVHKAVNVAKNDIHIIIEHQIREALTLEFKTISANPPSSWGLMDEDTVDDELIFE